MTDHATPPTTNATPGGTGIPRRTTANWVGYTALALVALFIVVVAIVLIAARTVQPTVANPEPPVFFGQAFAFVAMGVVAGALGWVMSVASMVTFAVRRSTNLWTGIVGVVMATPFLAVVGYLTLFVSSTTT